MCRQWRFGERAGPRRAIADPMGSARDRCMRLDSHVGTRSGRVVRCSGALFPSASARAEMARWASSGELQEDAVRSKPRDAPVAQHARPVASAAHRGRLITVANFCSD